MIGMSTFGLICLLFLNFGISFWNAYASGAYLTESKLIGGWMRLLVWCGLIMSGCGFTWTYLTLLSILAVSTGYLTPEWGEIMFKLGYLIIILPVLGSGLGIWVHSIAEMFRKRNFSSVAIAGWNTYAQSRNTWEAARHAPGFFKDVLSAFGGSGKGGKKDSKQAGEAAAMMLVIVLVVIAVFGGAITTGVIARWADRKVALKIQ
jgi:hypothetical protein